MPVPSQCQGIADELEQLNAEKRDLQSQLEGLAGPEKWKIVAEIARIMTKIQATSGRLDACVLAFGPGYRVDIVLLDLVPGGSVAQPVTGHICALFPPGRQNVVESVAALTGTCTFVHPPTSPPPAAIGLSVDEQGSAIFDGQLFRSGTLGALPASSTGFPAPTVEIVAAPPVQIPASMVTAPASIPGLPSGVTLSGPPTAMLSSGAITIAVTGTITATIFSFTVAVPFSYALSVTLTPSGDVNNPARVCSVRQLGPGTLTTTAGGLLGLIFSFAAPGLEPSVTSTVVPGIEAAINALILSSVAGAVPAGAVVSMRRIVITASGIALFPAVGRFLP